VLQKRAIRLIHNAGDHTHSLILKFSDLVKYQSAQIMFKSKIIYCREILKYYSGREREVVT